MLTPLLLTSFELPFDPARLSQDLGDSDVLTGLGPVLTGETLPLILEAQAQERQLSLLNYLGPSAWALLCDPARKDSALRKYLRPIACAITELMMSDQEISRLEHDLVSQDRVLERYSENIFWDLHPPKSLLSVRLRCGYWSRVLQQAVWCQPRSRSLTPKFGELYPGNSTRIAQ